MDWLIDLVSSVLVFMSSTGKGFQIDYRSITLHAVSKSDSDTPYVYCQLDSEEQDEADDEDMALSELSIIPPNTADRTSLCVSLRAILMDGLKWKIYSKPYLIAPHSTPTQCQTLQTKMKTRTSPRQHSSRLTQKTKNKN